MIKPPCVRAGDVVGVVAPSDAVDEDMLARGIKVLEAWGLKVKVGSHVYSYIGDFSAGTAEERREDLMTMLNDSEVRVIWAADGGYAATEVMPVFSKDVINKLRLNPKWFVGYSDTCLILNALNSFDMVSVMGPNLVEVSEWDKRSIDILKKTIFGERTVGIETDARWRAVIPGEVVGKVLASNLETLVLSFGTRFDPIMYGRGDVILAIEELDIDKSLLVRQLDIILSHKRSKRIKGIVVGRLSNIREKSYPEWGRKVTTEGLVADRAKRFGVPMAFCADFGHPEFGYGWVGELRARIWGGGRYIPLVSGAVAALTISEKECKLTYLEEVCSNGPTTNQTQPGLVRDDQGQAFEGYVPSEKSSG